MGEVSRRGGADESRKEELGIWNTDEEENSGKDSTCGGKVRQLNMFHLSDLFRHQHVSLTLSLLPPGPDRSWSERCWFQLESVGPDMLRPTAGYELIWLDRPTWVRWWSCAPGDQVYVL